MSEYTKKTGHKFNPGTYVRFKNEQVWLVGYEREYTSGSAEVRQVIVQLRTQLLSVCEHECRPWAEEDDRQAQLHVLAEIFDAAGVALHGEGVAMVDQMKKVHDMAARGLGYAHS